ncbi:SpoIIE family protein phosphatase [Leptospira sp. GIMC2001]|uniref:SpoIIE family protein phosphatase n=1 Tax=Leptospira sp. GIMC2001 TaxID=1513297 RepID=UPI00234B0D05|nr:SpoIIE family protein phosphatase [Leptospira sp. GIMC2001]WCL49056.1 SpoIIE family protein phosphatase [Leptospira sp. GIMC2001]
MQLLIPNSITEKSLYSANDNSKEEIPQGIRNSIQEIISNSGNGFFRIDSISLEISQQFDKTHPSIENQKIVYGFKFGSELLKSPGLILLDFTNQSMEKSLLISDIDFIQDKMVFIKDQVLLLLSNFVLQIQNSEKDFKILNQYIESDDLYNNSPIGYITVNSIGDILKANITFLDWIKLPKKKIVGHNLIDNFILPEYREAMRDLILNVIQGINVNELEVEIKSSKSNKLFCLVSGRNYFDKEKFARLSFFDMTEKAIIKKMLDEEMEKVIHNNSILNRDLEMAAKIQTRLLPSNNLFPFVEYIYKPLDQLGGDFCDLFRVGESIGIFISDVAGHGVPSAFVTAILKSSIEKSSDELKNDPAKFLAYLNESIIDFCDGRFVTAIYCLYNENTKMIKFSCAGHPSPYYLRDNSVSSLSLSLSGRPLGIFPMIESHPKYKMYQNEELQLISGDRLIFYTDGLLEAGIVDSNQEVFFEDLLLDKLILHSKLPLRQYLNKIIYELDMFLGDHPLEDDICMIGLDIS